MTEDQVLMLVERRLRHPWRMRNRPCLRKGLLLFYLLRSAGIPAVLQFGVYANRAKPLKAHCWVMVNGRCLADPPDDQCVVVLEHPCEQTTTGN
jgi:hypothetical protein